MDTLGSIHVVFGLCALVIGTLVVLIRKGTRFHRAIGHGYFASMLGLNVTALLIYRVTGKFNFFHAAALFSLMCIFIGIGSVVLLRPKKLWLEPAIPVLTGQRTFGRQNGAALMLTKGRSSRLFLQKWDD